MPTVTNDPLRAEALDGLKDPRALLTTVNRIQSEAGDILNGGATLLNAWRVVLTGVEVVVPDEWRPLTPINGFSDFVGNFAVRKDPFTKRVELREGVSRAAGAPAAGTVIAELPSGYGPATYGVRVAASDSGFGSYDLNPASGGALAQVRWQSGTPTSNFWLNAGSWQPIDPSIPSWDKPVTCRLTDRRITGSTVVRLVLCTVRTQDDSAFLLSTATFPGASIQAPQKPGEPFLLALPRIDGLVSGRRYNLTLWAFLE